MTFTQSISTCFSKYVDFSGRAPRSEFWWWQLFFFLTLFLTNFTDILIFGIPSYDYIVYYWWYTPSASPLTIMWILITFLPTIAVDIRRLHDAGYSGWYYLVSFIPIIGIFWLILLWLLKSEEKDNKYGTYQNAP